MKNKHLLLIRHILEIRLKKRKFSFIDNKGDFIDFLIKELNFDLVKFNSSRIDVAKKDLTEFFFFSVENFGFQIEAVDNFEIFNEKVNTLFSLISKYRKFDYQEILRLGTKSEILCHIKGKNFEELKNIFKNSLFTNFVEIEKKTNFKISDYAFITDLINEKGKVNLLIGPVTTEEAIQKYFNNHEKYKIFNKKNGIYLSIDFFQDQNYEINKDKLKEQAKANIENIRNLYESIVSYLINH